MLCTLYFYYYYYYYYYFNGSWKCWNARNRTHDHRIEIMVSRVVIAPSTISFSPLFHIRLIVLPFQRTTRLTENECLQKTVVREQWRRLEFAAVAKVSRSTSQWHLSSRSSAIKLRSHWTGWNGGWLTTKWLQWPMTQLQLSREESQLRRKTQDPSKSRDCSAAMDPIYEFENIKNLYNFMGLVHFRFGPSFSCTRAWVIHFSDKRMHVLAIRQ